MNDRPEFVYVTYIESTPEAVWRALTDADLTAKWWGHSNVSDWSVGSQWEHRRLDGTGTVDVIGDVVESTPPTRLVLTAARPEEHRPHDPGRLTFDIEPHGSIVRLTVTEDNFIDTAERDESARCWPGVIANLKSLLETGSPLSEIPWLEPQL